MCASGFETKILDFPTTPAERAELKKKIAEKKSKPVRDLVLSIERNKRRIIIEIPPNPTVGYVIPELSKIYTEKSVPPLEVCLFSTDPKLGYFIRLGSSADEGKDTFLWTNLPFNEELEEIGRKRLS